MALSAARLTQSRNHGIKRSLKMKASTTIYAGGMVMIDSGGYARPAAALASNKGVVGVAVETKTSGGSDGDTSVIVQEGEFLMVAASIAQSAVGGKVYASADDTMDETQGSNEPLAGLLTEYVSSTSGWVKIGLTEAWL